MAHLIEKAKSGRARCRKCREKIEKDELRFGFESDFEGAVTMQWYHLKCAAEKVPNELSGALQDCDEDIPDLKDLESTIAANRKSQKPTSFPYAELAPSGRSSCQVCGDKIEKDEWRIAVEREIDAGNFTRKGAGYLHPSCASEYEDCPDDLPEAIEANSVSLEPDQLNDVLELLE